jgi:hypothetical protein
VRAAAAAATVGSHPQYYSVAPEAHIALVDYFLTTAGPSSFNCSGTSTFPPRTQAHHARLSTASGATCGVIIIILAASMEGIIDPQRVYLGGYARRGKLLLQARPLDTSSRLGVGFRERYVCGGGGLSSRFFSREQRHGLTQDNCMQIAIIFMCLMRVVSVTNRDRRTLTERSRDHGTVTSHVTGHGSVTSHVTCHQSHVTCYASRHKI